MSTEERKQREQAGFKLFEAYKKIVEAKEILEGLPEFQGT